MGRDTLLSHQVECRTSFPPSNLAFIEGVVGQDFERRSLFGCHFKRHRL